METGVRPRLPVSLSLSLATLRHGPRDPSVRLGRNEVRRATNTPAGPACVLYAARGDEILVQAVGAGAAWCIETAPAVCGARDSLDEWEPRRHPVVADLDRRLPGMRMVATNAVLEAAVRTVLEQKVTSEEAHEAWRKIVWRWGTPAPGVEGMRLPPAAERLGAEPYYRYHGFGVERKRADIIKRLAARPRRGEEATTVGRSR